MSEWGDGLQWEKWLEGEVHAAAEALLAQNQRFVRVYEHQALIRLRAFLLCFRRKKHGTSLFKVFGIIGLTEKIVTWRLLYSE